MFSLISVIILNLEVLGSAQKVKYTYINNEEECHCFLRKKKKKKKKVAIKRKEHF